MWAVTVTQALEMVGKSAVPVTAVWASVKWGRKAVLGWRASQALVVAQQTTIIGAITALKQEQEIQSATLSTIRGEVEINGGKSLKDLVRKTLRSIRLETASRDLTETRAIWRGEVNPDGSVGCLYVSDEWKRLTGLDAIATENGGWARCVAPVDRARVLLEVQEATDEARLMQCEYTVVNVLTGARYPVRHVGTPVHSAGVLIGWIGILTVLSPVA